jgi:hypothetical protein
MLIKFNAWDNQGKKMLYWDNLVKLNLISEVLLDKKRYIPLLFSGILDKKGNELYFGDVYITNFSNSLYTIDFINGAFTGGVSKDKVAPIGWESPESDYEIYDLIPDFEFPKQVTKIGNIYEGLKVDYEYNI